MRAMAYVFSGLMAAIAGLVIAAGIGSGEAANMPTEAELAREVAVRRSTVREVVRVLVSKGMLEVRPRNGTRVCPRSQWRQLDRDLVRWTFAEGPDPSLLRDLIEMRRIVEPGSAALAASDLLTLETAYHAMEAALPHDIRACVAADVASYGAASAGPAERRMRAQATLAAATDASRMSIASAKWASGMVIGARNRTTLP